MSMVEPGSTISSGTGDPSGDPAPASSGINSWSQGKKMAVFGGGGLVLLVAIYLYSKSKSSAASTATSTTGANSTTPTLVLPSSNQDVTASTDYASLTQGLGNLSNQLSQLQSTNPTPVTTTPVSTPTQPTTTTTPVTTNNGGLPAGYTGWKQVTGPGGQILDVVGGYNANSQYSGFEVGGGAPVYAMNPGGTWQLGLPASSLQPGAAFAVPTQYQADVNTANPVTNAPPF